MILPFKGSYKESQDWNDPRYRSSYYKFGLLGHNGKDYATPVGTQIIAPHKGRVVEAAFDQYGYGWYIKVENEVEGSILAHFKEAPKFPVGAYVQQGDVIGLSGNTGNSTGPHLHWGYYRLPRKRDNGFAGTIDQTHWLLLEDYESVILELEEKISGLRDSRNDWRDKCERMEKILEEFHKFEEENKKLHKENSLLKDKLATAKDDLAEKLTLSEVIKLLIDKLKWE